MFSYRQRSTDEKELFDQALQFVVGHTAEDSDLAFIRDLANFLERLLDVDLVICAAVSEQASANVETFVMWHKGELRENINFDLAGSPCYEVVGAQPLICESGVVARYPDAAMLAGLDVDSYVGVPLWGADGAALGLLSVLDSKPIANGDLVVRILQIVATRAASELERYRGLVNLRNEQRRFADFVEVSSDWYWESDAQLRFSFFSERFEMVTGINPVDMLGKTREEVGAPGADPSAMAGVLAALHEHRAFHDFIYYHDRSGRQRVHLSFSGKPVFDGDGKFSGFRGVGRDVTERIESEQAIRAAELAARRSDRAKSQFLANMSHELRSPLNAVIGFSEMMLLEQLGPIGNDRYKEYIEGIHSASRHLIEVISDILDLSKIEAGVFDIEECEFDMADLIQSALSIARPMSQQRGQILETAAGFGSHAVWADERLLRQVLVNLLSNAIKFSPDGDKILIDESVGPDGGVVVAVTDHGMGIAEENLEMVFEPFGQVRDDVAVSQKGIGLGLSLSRRIVEMHGGTLEIESALGEGTTAKITLPPDRNIAKMPPETEPSA